MAERTERSTRVLVRRVAGLGALIAGLCWTVKAGVVLAGGAQPDYAAEFAPAAQGLAIVALTWAFKCGLFARLFALAAFGAGVAAALAYVSAPDDWIYNLAMFMATVLVVASLLLAGRTLSKRRALGLWSRLPLRLGIWTIPLILAGGLLSAINERLLELPVLLLGLAWLWLAVVLLVDRLVRPRAQPAPKPAQARATRRPVQSARRR